MELGGEQGLGLSQAAQELRYTARPIETRSSSLSPTFGSLVYRRTARIDFVCSLTLVVAVLGITAATVGHVADRNPPTPAPAVASMVRPLVPAPAAPAEPRGQLVQVRNPFDASEVFEFPAETSKTEARNVVAELLLQRARDRRHPGIGIEPAGARTAAGALPEAFVTKLSGHPSTVSPL
jgi:hypothetical protein